MNTNQLKAAAVLRNALAHSVFFIIALILAYNTYKEYLRGWDGEYLIRPEFKALMKASFPWAVLIFFAVYLLHNLIIRGKKSESSNGWSGRMVLFYAFIANFAFISSGQHVLAIQNISILYFSFFLIVWSRARNISIDLSPIDSMKGELLDMDFKKTFKLLAVWFRKLVNEDRLSSFLIKSFGVLMFVCAALLCFGADKLAERLGNLAYFSIAAGIAIETYHAYRHEGDEK